MVLPIGPRRRHEVEVVDDERSERAQGIRGDEISGFDARIRLEGSPDKQLIVDVPPGRQVREAGFIVENFLVGLDLEGEHFDRLGNEIGGSDEVARFHELVLDVPKRESVRKSAVTAEISGVIPCQPQLRYSLP